MTSGVPVSPILDFIDTYLPNTSVGTVMRGLQERKVLVPRSGSRLNRPSSSPEKPPVHSHSFRAFEGPFAKGSLKPSRVVRALKAIENAVRKVMGLKTRGTDTNKYSIRVVDGEDDILITCMTDSNDNVNEPLHSTKVVIPFRIASGTSRTNKGTSDPLPDFMRVVNEDARRKHLYAITIEDADMSLWYVSRSRCAKSAPFDMQKHPDLLVRALVSLMSATDQELGYDPLVTLLPDLTYVYELPPDEGRKDPHYYQNTELISEFHSDDAVGRSARVWKVKQVFSPTDLRRVPGTSDRILKDVSLDARMKPEVDIQRQLFADIAAFGERPDWRSAGVLKDMRQEDMDALVDALDGENFKKYFSCIVASHVGKPYSCPARSQSQSLPFGDGPSPTFVPKRRCFYLYEFICTPLYDICTLGEAIDILKQCLTAMRLMYCAGWIHRDISVGNILAIRPGPEAPWEMKLSDLEYARRFLDPEIPKGEKPIGTPFFMACELQARVPLIPEEDDPTIDSEEDDDLPEPLRPVSHSYQHDLESIWWIILWLVTARLRAGHSRAWSDTFFKHSRDIHYGQSRYWLLSCGGSLESLAGFPSDLPPSLYGKSFLGHLSAFRFYLCREYRRRYGANGLEDPGSYSWIMGEGASKFFRGAQKSHSQWGSVQLIVESEIQENRWIAETKRQEPSSSSAKRKAEEEVAGPDAIIRAAADKGHEQKKPHPPRKRPRLTKTDFPAQPQRRTGPVTRSMTRDQRAGPTTRSMTRRLQRSAAGSTRQTRSSNRRTRA
ncbi:other/FunK1 protein kinase [Coprinopsis cinerea okayama7|uniref:Other/FunK1 protein kinase n=1 Tax=Coprinopsis cinerea (strain Okayama-7 / 130 / ATCC MYA-4618 / FGSC 9003) TaxID=240176 RepID=D6RPM6_COPC7|nr:other/FunK1 protein kinase [Coprinopsis cinerea okayama7\|eukprot:XP_002910495.1 other/FunK1 protein kinase [Coprinopsis cinerea okayama7\